MSGRELDLVRDTFESNWVTPCGPHVDAFEREVAELISGPAPELSMDERRPSSRTGDNRRESAAASLHAAALSSGTAALHLALRILTNDRAAKDEGRGNEVLGSTLTFAASANAIVYEGGVPVFVDSDAGSWNMDPGLLREELEACVGRGKPPRAVVVVDLYGQCADYDPILAVCAEHDVPVIEDAAEALGATYWGATDKAESRNQRPESRIADTEFTTKAQRHEEDSESSEFRVQSPESRVGGGDGGQGTMNDERRTRNARAAGSFGACAAFSFNGNKIITTAGGGMLVSHDKAVTEKARFLATQAKDPAPHYQHSEIGFNYRMSNVLAAIGRGQLAVLPERIAARRRNFEFYRQVLGRLPGIEFMPEAPYGRCTRWLTCLTIDPRLFGATREDVRLALEKENIEARPVWKPMHLQPVFAGLRVRGGGVSERLFESGLCLPSGSALTEEDLERICTVVKSVRRRTEFHYVPPRAQPAGWPARPDCESAPSNTTADADVGLGVRKSK